MRWWSTGGFTPWSALLLWAALLLAFPVPGSGNESLAPSWHPHHRSADPAAWGAQQGVPGGVTGAGADAADTTTVADSTLTAYTQSDEAAAAAAAAKAEEWRAAHLAHLKPPSPVSSVQAPTADGLQPIRWGGASGFESAWFQKFNLMKRYLLSN